MLVPALLSAIKRLVVGRAFASERLARERLPIRLALPTFAADTLSSIARAHGTTATALAQLNHLSDPDLIRVGQVLTLPS